MSAQAGGRRLLAHSVLSMLDQAWLSAINLGMGLYLIRLTSQEVYGIYSQLFVGGIFAVTVAESLVVNPLVTLASGRDRDERTAMLGHLGRFHRRLSLAMALVSGVCCVVAVSRAGADSAWPLGLGFAAYVYTGARREYQRSANFIEARPDWALRTDLIYGVVLAVAAAALALLSWLSLPAVLVAMTVANLCASRFGPQIPPAPDDSQGYRRCLSEVWKRGRLGLPGAVSSWIVNYSYLYLTAAWLGAVAAAELNASRLLLMPVSLIVVAWSRVARPMIGRMLAGGDAKGLARLMLSSVIGVELVAVIYVAALWPALPLLETHVLGEAYRGVGALVAAWAAYFALYSLRSIGSALLLSADGYRMLLAIALSSLVELLVLLPFALHHLGAIGAVIALCVVEALNLLLVWAVGIPRIRSRMATTA